MITNNIGTILYSLLYGKRVGEDNQGKEFWRFYPDAFYWLTGYRPASGDMH